MTVLLPSDFPLFQSGCVVWNSAMSKVIFTAPDYNMAYDLVGWLTRANEVGKTVTHGVIGQWKSDGSLQF